MTHSRTRTDALSTLMAQILADGFLCSAESLDAWFQRLPISMQESSGPVLMVGRMDFDPGVHVYLFRPDTTPTVIRALLERVTGETLVISSEHPIGAVPVFRAAPLRGLGSAKPMNPITTPQKLGLSVSPSMPDPFHPMPEAGEVPPQR